MRIYFATLIAAALTSAAVAADPAPGKQVEQSFTDPAGTTVPYLLHLPKGMAEEPDKKWPVMLFLHGRGESRGPLSVVAKWGPPRLAARGGDLPYIVVSPQCPADKRWVSPDQVTGVLALLDDVLKSYPGDKDRVYLTGLSMGGQGAWNLATHHIERFAAAAIVCGATNPTDAKKLKDLPIWVFHGTEDEAVRYRHSVDMVAAIEKAGGKKVRFTTYKHVGHNSWSSAYALPELYQWLDRHHRGE